MGQKLSATVPTILHAQTLETSMLVHAHLLQVLLLLPLLVVRDVQVGQVGVQGTQAG